MRRAVLAAVGVFTMLAGCSPPDAPAPVPTQVESRPHTLDDAARAGPEPFVRALYARYADGAMPVEPPPGRNPAYSRKLNAMIGADDRQNTGVMTFDPICDCREGPVVLRTLETRTVDPNRAEADVVLDRGGEVRRQSLILIREGPAWRVEDVVVEGRDPLSVTLLAAIS